MRMNAAHIGTHGTRRAKSTPTNVSLDAALVAEARELGVNISQASAAGLENAVAKARAERWIKENGAALEWWNAYVEEHGLPLESLRQF
jgi:antitoxin CcdA